MKGMLEGVLGELPMVCPTKNESTHLVKWQYVGLLRPKRNSLSLAVLSCQYCQLRDLNFLPSKLPQHSLQSQQGVLEGRQQNQRNLFNSRYTEQDCWRSTALPIFRKSGRRNVL